jgi:hypothetical protein
MRVQQLEDFIREQCGQEPPVNSQYQEEPFFFNNGHGRQNSIGSIGGYSQLQQDRKYQPFAEDGQHH